MGKSWKQFLQSLINLKTRYRCLETVHCDIRTIIIRDARAAAMDTSPLCDFCCKLNFHSLVRRARNPEGPGNNYQDQYDRDDQKVYGESAASFSYVKDIYTRRSRCKLCNIVSKRLEAFHAADEDECFVSSETFCGKSLEVNPTRYTQRMSFTLGRKSSEHEGVIKGRHKLLYDCQDLLQLQACCKSVPTVADVAGTPPFRQVDDSRFRGSKFAGQTQDERQDVFLWAAHLELKDIQEGCLSQDDCVLIATHYNTSDDPRFSGRIIGHGPLDLNLVKFWLSTCETSHTICEKLPRVDNSMPDLNCLLVIDVVQKCVVEAPSKCRYVALSYCWGTVQVLKHQQ
ncbi:hypothetical protein GLAREA_05313 [Glarea lozoyensis ATCC 20868]|uniref:Uncharacterized protein n=1 Tax=Glarea lozoyensis (strain ATCC 20868 / MF5171) TaxID=1116229 RepID=S3DDY8_GLAL2|nr:uncharacterized protein GLAREA_05313 [Glarea lozoyensis ATCC 20868]EPE35975.1 hypothetical protein GLAREA_05313 [Glarea lozoyensis ATCC 20868]